MSSIKYYDIHSHKEADLPDIIQVISLECSELDRLKKEKFFSAGVHPWRVPGNSEEQLNKLETLLESNSIIAVGEIGLDKRCKTPFALQESVFSKQLELAEKYKKPVIIHCVRAWQEIIAFKKSFPNQKWVMHGFNKNHEQAKSLLNCGVFLSFGTGILKNNKTAEALAKAPLDRIFLETDISSVNIVDLYRKTADIRGIELEELASSIEKNFRKMFGEKL